MEGPDNIDFLMLKGAVMSANMAMAITDPHQPDNPIVFTNPAFSRMAGYEPNYLVGRNCRLLQGEATNRQTVAAIHAALAAGQEIQTDILNYKKNGAPFMNRLFISPVHDRRGQIVHYFASQLDVTESTREIAIKSRREAVLRQMSGELNQRLSSTMQVVQSLVSQTLASASSVVEASEALSARLLALGQVYSKITENDWDDEDFESLVNEALSPFRDSFGTVELRGPALKLTALLNLRLSSAMYELCANTAMTRNCARTARRLDVDWSLDTNADRSALNVIWCLKEARDLDDISKSRILRAVSGVLSDAGAKVSVRSNENGMTCCISVPLAAEVVELQLK